MKLNKKQNEEIERRTKEWMARFFPEVITDDKLKLEDIPKPSDSIEKILAFGRTIDKHGTNPDHKAIGKYIKPLWEQYLKDGSVSENLHVLRYLLYAEEPRRRFGFLNAKTNKVWESYLRDIVKEIRRIVKDQATHEADFQTNPDGEITATLPASVLEQTILKDKDLYLRPKKSGQPLLIDSVKNWKYPPVKLVEYVKDRANAGDPNKFSEEIEKAFLEFDIEVDIEKANIGPRLTQYIGSIQSGDLPEDLKPIADHISSVLDLAPVEVAVSHRLPSVIGVEVPNMKSSKVSLGKYLRKDDSFMPDSKLSFMLGMNQSCKIELCDLGKVNHLLIGGQTGSGKSLFIESILITLLLKNSPSDLQLILIDPKQVQFTPYNEIPHLIAPVLKWPEETLKAVKWVLREIQWRYTFLSQYHIRTSKAYNEKFPDEVLPDIIVMCEEIADLMMLDGEWYEKAFNEIIEKGRAVGIHLIIATSRPSKDVFKDSMINSLPTKIAFATASSVDSKHILGRIGAEKLLGAGDMLFKASDSSSLKRLQAPYLSDDDVGRVTDFLKLQSPPEYRDMDEKPTDYDSSDDEVLYKDALKFVIAEQKAGTAMLQRRFQIGYGRAAWIIERMEEEGVVGPADGATPRKVYRSEP